MLLRLSLVSSFLIAFAVAPACSCGVPPGGEGEGAEGEGGPGEGEGGPGEGEGEGEGATRVVCNNVPAVSPGADVCAVTQGTGGVVVVGDVLLPGSVIEGGGVTIEDDGTISCVGCDCIDNAGTKTQVVCPDAVVSAGFINSHDHAGWMNDVPWVPGTKETPIADVATRWEQRHDWRKGLRGNPKILVGGGANQSAKALGELRFILGGATATNASGGFSGPKGDGTDGFLRNVDDQTDMQAIGSGNVDYQTFPLGDSNGTQLTSGCGYPGIIDPPSPNIPYSPHVAEGIDGVAHNEFVCLSSTANGGHDQLTQHTAIIHGVGLLPGDVALMAQKGASLIWSPRSNVSLYGDTAQIPLFKHLGVNVALGTDWIPSGSINMLRELACVQSLNADHWNSELSDEDMWRMVTSNAAHATGTDNALGVLAPGHRGDVAVFAKAQADGTTRADYTAAIQANVQDVALVLKDGKPLSGNKNVVTALDTGCDDLDVCGVTKQVCATREAGQSLAALTTAANGSHYDLFFCGAVTDEPTCDPSRTLSTDSVDQSNNYSGVDSAGADSDGDGIPDAQDNCPNTFNPIRPLDNGTQADADGDHVGDVCDPCPLDANTTTCSHFDPNDSDGDGVPNAVDNCPADANPDQADADGDHKGDACDACPNDANPGPAGCPASVYDLKSVADPTSVDNKSVSIKDDVVVTAVAPKGFFLQVAPGSATDQGVQNGCIFVFQSGGTFPALGDHLAISVATVSNFFSEIELKNVTFTVSSSGLPPDPTVLSAADVAAAITAGARSPFEACLVHVDDADVTNATPAPGAGDNCGGTGQPACNEFEIDGGLRVDDVIFLVAPAPTTGQVFPSIQGPMQFKNGLLKILPRDANDLALGPPALAGVDPPTTAFVRLNAASATTFPAPLTVRMDRAPSTDTTVLLTSSSSDIVVPASVTIAANSTTANVPVTSTANAATATITAKLNAGDAGVTGTVQSIADNAAATATSLTPSSALVPFATQQTFTVALDIPAPRPNGATVTLAASPASLGTLPANVTVPADALSATFAFTAGSTAQNGTVTATLGAGVSADVGVTSPAAGTVDFSGFTLSQTNAAHSLTLPAGTEVPIDGFLLVVRGKTRTEFESFFGVTLPANVVYVDAAADLGVTFPVLNGNSGGQTVSLLRADGQVVDGPTIAMSGSNKSFHRSDPAGAANAAGSWTSTAGTPGAGPTPGVTPTGQNGGCYVAETEVAPSGTGNFNFEYVEVYCDAPLP